MATQTFTADDVAKIAKLANIPVSDDEKTALAAGFTTTMSVVDALGKAKTAGVEPTHQVTGFENVFRDDAVDEARMFTQQQALANAPRTYAGFFVVDRVLDQTIDP
jgi:aspartyl/glutamyl-tRNA(Asn/Gln) amidotransferase C subunit